MLHSSPMASRDADGLVAACSPSIKEAKREAVMLVQRMMVMPHSAPAIPTIAVCSPAGGFVFAGVGSNRMPAIISNTSSTAHSRMDFQLGSKCTAAGEELVIGLTAHLREAARRVL